MAGKRRPILEHSSGLLLDSLYAGVLGGSAVALFFLVVDLMDGQPLFTPSLFGNIIFLGASVEDPVNIRLDTVVYFSVVHIAAFAALGALISLLVHEVELHSKHPVVVMFVLFAIIEALFFITAPAAFSGVIERLGIYRVAGANLFAAGSMALFFVSYHRPETWQKVRHNTVDFIFDSFYAGAIGGSVVALFFLLTDVLQGQPLFTPSLMGSVLFRGLPVEAATDVDLEAVAYFSILHMLMFGALGILVSFLVYEAELHSRHPLVVLLVLFAVIETVFFTATSVALPGVVAELGILRVATANLLAAGSLAAFFVFSHRADAWEKVKHAAHLA